MAEISLTAAETKLLTGVVKFLNGPIDTDWEQAAAFAGYSNVAACRACWGRLKRTKLEGGTEAAGNAVGASQKRKAGAEGGGGAKKPRPKRAKKDAAAAGESMNGVVDPEAEGGAKVKVEEAADG